MSAESPRRFTRLNGNAVRPQPVSDKSVMESVVDFFQDVAYNTQPDDREKIMWVQFERADVNDANSNPSGGFSAGNLSPLLLILGYANGIHIWMIPSSGEAQEVMSLRQGPVRLVRFLVNPSPVFDVQDSYTAKRPLVVVCDASSAGQPYCSAKFLSLRTGDEVHHIPYTEPVTDIRANDRVLVVAFEEKLIVYDACRFRERFTITACYSTKEFSNLLNPFALGSRWLAYADKKLVAVQQSCGGMVGENNQSYTATIISAAKTLSKGLSLITESVANSLTGNKATGVGVVGAGNMSKKIAGSPEAAGCRPGVVTIVDVQNVVDPQVMVQEDSDGVGLVAHFVAHANGYPISTLAFDPSGILLFTADSLGHSFHVFKVMSHPLSCALGAVHHLYTLHRGDTTAKIQSVDFTLDSRWVAVTTLRGTTHVFPITAYGGPVNVRTHTSSRVVNRASRFHRSAGLEDMELHMSGRDSPVYPPGSPSSSPGRTSRHGFGHERSTAAVAAPAFALGNANNSRLPPYPNPVLVTPVVQIRQNLAIPGLGGGAVSGTTTASGGVRARSSAGQGAAAVECVCVAACFAPSRGYFAGTPPGSTDDKRVVDSLFVINWTGMLIEYVLDPHAKQGVDKITDESPVSMTALARAQWPLGRSIGSSEVKLPLPCNHSLILACDAVLSQKTSTQQNLCQGQSQPTRDRQSGSDSSTEENDEQWLSQVEIVTHAGPHRRLWMGPQFAFKTFPTEGAPTTLSSNSPILLSDCADTQMTMMDVDTDLSSLCLTSRSSPMDVASGVTRRSQDGATVIADTCGSLPYATVIEAADSGSFGQSPGLLETQFGFSDSSSRSSAGMAAESVEDQLRLHLADAMTESPLKDFHNREYNAELAQLSLLTRGPDRTQSYLVHSSPPHCIDQLLVFSGDPPSPSSD